MLIKSVHNHKLNSNGVTVINSNSRQDKNNGI